MPGLNSNGLILYEGPSRIVPSRSIVVICTGLTTSSANPKTGPMIQSWILDASEEPHQANRSNADRSVCGACKFRVDPITGKRTCYVTLHHAPLNVFRAYARGSYARVDWSTWPDLVRGRWGRLGSFGDPAACDPSIWERFCAPLEGYTGYTHQSASPRLRDVLEWCSVSADSLEDARAARSAGVGSFRVLGPESEPRQPWEMHCPASKEKGYLKTCQECGACSGRGGANVVINAHGNGSGNFRETNRRPLSLPILS